MKKIKWIALAILAGSFLSCVPYDVQGYSDQKYTREVTLLLNSEPHGARVYSEGTYKGKTPLTLSYSLEYTARWYNSQREKPLFFFQEGDGGAWQPTKPLSILLDGYEPQTKNYRFNAEEVAFKTEFSMLCILEPKPEAKPAQQQQQQQQQQTVILNPERERPAQKTYGSLTIISTPPQAEIYIDGSFVASSPASNLQLEAGQHKIEIIKTGYVTWMRFVQVLANSPANIDVTLEIK